MICEVCGSDIRDDAAFCPHCGERVSGGPTYDDYVYEAFISYRHLPRDTKVATRLQRSLEGYRLPRGIRRKDDGATRLGKLFRDQDELPTSQSLGDQIEDALKRSRRLVVVCTPQTSESRWVQREVELFASFHGRDAIVIALAAGEPEESFPELLRSRLVRTEDGRVERVEEEPIAADFREGTRRQFNLERLRVAASIIGCGFDELRQRQHARRMRTIAAAATVVAALSTAFGSFSLYQQHQIEENYRQTQIKESESLAVDSARLLAQGDRMQAIQVAMAALPQSSTSNDRPFVPAAQLALERALQVYPTESYWRSCYSIGDVESTYAACEEGLQAFLKTDGTILVTTIADGVEVCSFDPKAVVGEQEPGMAEYLSGSSSFMFCGDRLLWWNGKLYGLFDARTGELVWVFASEYPQDGEQVYLSEDQSLMAIACPHISYEKDQFVTGVTVTIVSTDQGKQEQSFELPLEGSDSLLLFSINNRATIQMDFSSDGNTIAVTYFDHIYLIELDSGEMKKAELQQPNAYAVKFVGDNVIAISTEQSGALDFGITPIDTGAYVDVFDMNLKLLWQTVEIPPKRANTQLTTEQSNAFIAGATNDETGLMLGIGYSIIIYDFNTGEQLQRTQTNGPITACERLGGALCVIDSTGSCFYTAAEKVSLSITIDHYTIQTAESEKAIFFLCDGTPPYLATWNSSSSSYRIYSMQSRYSSDGLLEVDDSSLIPLDGLWYSGSYPTEEGFLIVASDDSLISLDTQTIKAKWRVPISSVTEGSIISATGLENALAVVSKTASGGLSISLLSWQDGSLVDSIDTEAEYYTFNKLLGVEYGGKTCLMLSNTDALRVLDPDTHEELAVFSCEDKGSINRVWSIGDDLLIASSKGERCAFQVISIETGAEVPADIEDCVVYDSSLTPIAADFDDTNQGRFAVVDMEGTIHLYDTDSWSTIWESSEQYPKAQHLAFSRDGDHIVLQSLTGSFLLLSAQDGSVESVSSTTLPPITSSFFTNDDTLIASYTKPINGTALISLEPDCFGPIDDVFNGLFPMPTKDSFFTYDKSADVVAIFHHYTLDELIELGHETIKGHELTDAERYLYRIN